MLRIFLWRIVFEVFEFFHWLKLSGPKRYYFAFGGNLDPTVLKNRGIGILDEEYWNLEDHRLVFDQQGPFHGSGFASIQEAIGHQVYGKVYRISFVDQVRLHCFEAAIFLKKYRIVSAPYKNGHNLFFYQTSSSKEGLRPTQEYKDKILAGYKDSPGPAKKFVDDLKETLVLKTIEPAKNINFLISDYRLLGALFERLLRWYDNLCFSVFLKLIWKRGIVVKL